MESVGPETDWLFWTRDVSVWIMVCVCVCVHGVSFNNARRMNTYCKQIEWHDVQMQVIMLLYNQSRRRRRRC